MREKINLKLVLILLIYLVWLTPALHGDFVQVNENGFGDNDNDYIWSLKSYNNYLYAGIYYNSTGGSQIWRTPNGIFWTNVSSATNGFGNNNNKSVNSLITFNGQLYAGTYNNNDGGYIFRSADGIAWNQVVPDGFSDNQNTQITLISNNGYIYAGTLNSPNGSRIYRSLTGNDGSWSVIGNSTNGFGNQNNDEVYSFCRFQGYLYAGTHNSSGSEIYRSSDGTNWLIITDSTNGFNTGTAYVYSMIVFSNRLYAGCDNGTIFRSIDGTNWINVRVSDGMGIYDFAVYSNYLYCGSYNDMNGNGKLIRSPDGNLGSWEIVNDDGWGVLQNNDNYSIEVFNNALFVGNYNWMGGAVYSDLQFDYLTATVYSNVPETFVSKNSSNNVVLGFIAEDTFGDDIAAIKVSNLGNMSNSMDVTNLRLWYDVNKNCVWDISDIFAAGPAIYSNSIDKYCFENLSIPSGTNLILTIDISPTGRSNRWFKARIFGKLNIGDIICSNSGRSINTITNSSRIIIGEHNYSITKNVDFLSKNVGYDQNIEVLSLNIKNSGDHKLKSLMISNIGTMDNTDIKQVEIYYDNDNSYSYTPGDILFNSMLYDNTINKWKYPALAFAPPVELNTNILILIETSNNGIFSNTFKPFINIGDVRWECGAYNTTTVSNDYFITRIDEVVPYKIANISATNRYAGETNITVMNFTISNFYTNRKIEIIKISNSGDAENIIDISTVKLWSDSDNSGDWTPGIDSLIKFGFYVGSENYWNFNFMSVKPGSDLIVTVNLANGAREGRTFKGYIKKEYISNSMWVHNNKTISNDFSMTIQNTNDIVTIIPRNIFTGPVYTVTTNYHNKEVLAFKYTDTKSHPLQILNVYNLSNMQAGSDISDMRVWQDFGIKGKYEKSIDVAGGDLFWNGTGWTNSNLSIPEGSDILITLNTTSTLNLSRAFRAYTMSTQDVQCINSVNADKAITNNEMLIVDISPPDPVNLKNAYTSIDKLKIFFSGVTNSDLLFYQIGYDTTSKSVFSNYSFISNTVSTNVLIQGLNPDKDYYFRVRSIDAAGNCGPETAEKKLRTYGTFSWSLKQVNNTGFDVGRDLNRINSIINYKNNYYVCVENMISSPTSLVYKSRKGVNWEGIFFDNAVMEVCNFIVYSNCLYACTYNAGRIYRTTDGVNWTNVISDGFGDANNTGVQSFAIFNNMLYAGTENANGAQIWRSSDGNTWNKVVDSGLGNNNNSIVYNMIEFNSDLYAGICGFSGPQIWRSADGVVWNVISSTTNGFGDGDNNEINSIAVFNNKIYVGVNSGVSGCQIWASSDGNTWEKVITEGFLNIENIFCYNLSVYSNYLIAGTGKNFFPPIQFEWYRTSDGTNWQIYSPNDFNINNHGFTSMLYTGTNIFIGTYNWDYGAEIWSDITNYNTVIKTSNSPDMLVGLNHDNITVLSFQVNNSLEDNIDTIKIKNIGAMEPDNDISDVKLWYDKDLSYDYSTNDIQIGFPAAWNAGTQTWDFMFLNALPGTNLIVTIDISGTGSILRTFRAAIEVNNVKCNFGAFNNNTAITNSGTIMIASNYYVQTGGSDSNMGTSWGTNNVWQTISYAVNNVPANSTIFVADGIYPEEVNILNKNRINIVATNRAVVDAEGIRNFCFNIMGSGFIGIDSFEFINSVTALYSENSDSIIIKNSIITNNGSFGIRITNTDNSLITNCFISDSVNAVSIENGSSTNSIIETTITNNSTIGVSILGVDSAFNRIEDNNINNNGTSGIRLNAGSCTITNNRLLSNGFDGITVLGDNNSLIEDNSLIDNNRRAIALINGVTNCILRGNYIVNNTTATAIYITNSYLEISLNDIKSNGVGIYMSGVCGIDLNRNNIYSNSKNNIMNNASAGSILNLTNNWWDSTIAADIQSTISNLNGYSNFTPYRLFGEFNISTGADSYSVPVITMLNPVWDTTNFKLSWNQCTDLDFKGYNIYRKNIPGTTNLQKSDIISRILNRSVTNYTDNPGAGKWYYHITAIDDPSPPFGSIYTNESWYSSEVSTIMDIIYVITNINIPQRLLFETQTNQTIMAIKIFDMSSDSLDTLTITNLGTAEDSSDITNIKLWLDDGAITNQWDTGDSFIDHLPAVNNKRWQEIGVMENLEPWGINFIITADIQIGAGNYSTVIPKISCGGIINNSGFTNRLAVSNINPLIVAPRSVHNITLDLWYTNIQRAVNFAGDGDTIEVLPGVYYENIDISTNLTLWAYDWIYNTNNKTTVIDGNGNKYAVRVANNYTVNIQGFSLTDAGFGGDGIIMYTNGAAGTIVNNRIYSNSNDAIQVNNSSPTIRENEIFDSNGIQVLNDFSQPLIISNSLRNAGISLSVNSAFNGLEIRDNKFYRGNSGIGIYLNGCRNITGISNNEFYSNSIGISVFSGSNIVLTRNNFYKNTNGIRIWSFSKYVTLVSNTFATNITGTLIESSDNIIINDNFFSTNISSGLSSSNVNFINITNNRFNMNLNGMRIVSVTNAIIYNNIFCYNGDDGIFLNNLVKSEIALNNIFGNINGIELMATAVDSISNEFRNNWIHSNTMIGLRLNGNNVDRNSIISNSIHNNLRAVQVMAGDDNRIIYNSNYNNAQYGIDINNSADNTIVEGNYIANNTTATGIYINNSDSVISLNTLISNSCGIFVTGGSAAGVLKNNIYDNTIDNFTDGAGGNVIELTNNWWGTTILSNIRNKISGVSGYTLYTPYRLFGEFNIIQGTDTKSPSPVNNISFTIISNRDVVFNWNNSPGSTKYFVYRSNSNVWSNFTRNSVIDISSSTNYTNTGVPSGVYNYFFTALDNAVHTNESWYSTNIIVSVDSIPPPIVTLASPTNGFITNEVKMVFRWDNSIDLDSGTTNYQIKITNSTSGWITNIITSLTNTLLTNLDDGTNYWAVRAMDKVSNWNSWSTTNWFVTDQTPPVVTLVSPMSNITAASLNITFSWNANDALTGISNSWLEIDTNNNTLDGFEIITNSTSPITINFSGNGTNNWRVLVKDRAGNSNYSSTNDLIVDTNYDFLWVSITAQIPYYDIVKSVSNAPVMGFVYNDLQGHPLEVLHITNFGTMVSGQDITAVKLWYDQSALGVFNSNEIFISDLTYDNTSGKWTNNNLFISNNLPVLVTISISSNPVKGRSFRSGIISSNDAFCTNGTAISGSVMNNNSIIIDQNAPLFAGAITIQFLTSSIIRLSWTNAIDNAFGYNPITYNVFVSDDSGSFDFNVTNYSVINTNAMVLSDLRAGNNYFRIVAVDNMNNKCTNANTPLAVIDFSDSSFSRVKVYPNPVYKGEKLIVKNTPYNFSIEIFTISGYLAYDEEVKNSFGFYELDLENKNISSGVYIIILTAPNTEKQIKKFMFINNRRN